MKKQFGPTCLILILFGLVGCTFTGAVRSNIAPISSVSKTYNGDVSLVIDPAINTAEVTTDVGVHTVTVAAGGALNSAIVEAARLVFPKVSPDKTAMGLRNNDIVIQVHLHNISGNASLNHGFWSSTANITTQVSIVIEMQRKDGSLVYRQVVTGTGLQTQPDASPQNVRTGMVIALERAIQQLSDQTTTVFVTGLNQMK